MLSNLINKRLCRQTKSSLFSNRGKIYIANDCNISTDFQSSTVDITVNLMNEYSYPLRVPLSMSGGALATHIYENILLDTPFTPLNSYLTILGKPLNFHASLYYINICDGSVISVNPKLVGGSSDMQSFYESTLRVEVILPNRLSRFTTVSIFLNGSKFKRHIYEDVLHDTFYSPANTYLRSGFHTFRNALTLFHQGLRTNFQIEVVPRLKGGVQFMPFTDAPIDIPDNHIILFARMLSIIIPFDVPNHITGAELLDHFTTGIVVPSGFPLGPGEFWIKINNRPLNMNATLLEQNIFSTTVFDVLPRMRGGFTPSLDNMIFTNYLIKECEDELMWDYKLHSNEDERPQNFPQVTIKFIENYVKSKAKDIDINKIFLLFEDTVTCYKLFRKAESLEDIIRVVCLYYRLRTGESLVTTFFEYVNSFIEKLFAVQSQESNMFDKIKECFTNFEIFKKSEIMTKLSRVVALVMSLSFCKINGTEFNMKNFLCFDKIMVGMQFCAAVDIVSHILEIIVFICEKGYQCIITGSFSSIFHSSDKYKEWCDLVADIKIKSKHLADPEALGFSESEFLGQLDKAIEQGKDMQNYMTKMKKFEVKYVTHALNELIFIQAEQLTSQKAREYRDAPFSILINGSSSVGKSTITHMLFQHYGKLFDLPLEDKYKYTKNPVAKYWDGFKSYMWCLLIDDIAYMHPNAATNGDPSVMEVIQIQNNVAYVPDQAALEDKGRTPLRAKFCIATTNTKHLNAVHYFNCPLAVQRRLPLVVTVQPKPEYCTDGFLDSIKTPESDTYPDLWLWTVEKVKPGSNNRCSYEEVYSTSSVHDFLAYFSKEAVEFKAKQNTIKQSNNVVVDIKLCKNCYRDIKVCSCDNLPIQSLEIINLVSVSIILHIVSWILWWRPRFIKYVYPLSLYLGFNNPTITRAFWSYMGDSVGSAIMSQKVYKYISGTLVAVSAFLCAYKMYKKTAEVCDLNVESLDGEKPKPKPKERDNVWYQEEFELTRMDIAPESISTSGLSLDDFYKLIIPNIITIQCSSVVGDASIQTATSALCLMGNIYLINWHALKSMNDVFSMTIKTGVRNIGITNDINITVRKCQFFKVDKSDLAVFVIPSIPPKKNIFKFIPINKLTGTHVGFIASNYDRVNRMHTVRRAKFMNTYVVGVGETMDCYKCCIAQDQPTQEGYCGSPFIIRNGAGYHIAGVHVAGRADETVEIAISQVLLRPYLRSLEEYQVSSGQIRISTEKVHKSMLPLHDKSCIRFIANGCCDTYGSIDGFRATHKSQVEKTLMNDFFSRYGYETKYTKPDLKTWRPKHLAIKEMVTPQTLWDITLLEECIEGYTQDILDNLTDEDLEMLHILDLDSNINGAPGVAYIDHIKRTTSAGYPWKTPKTKFLTYRDDGQTVDVSDEILDIVEEMEKVYLRGERYNTIYSANLKDEPVTFKKAEMGKTRVFACASFPTVIIMRKYLLTYVRLVQNNKFTFEAGPGTIAQSTEWGQIYDYLTEFGEDRIIAGDFGKFDKKMSSSLIRAAFSVIINVLKRAKCSEEHIKIVQGIAVDVAYPMMDYFGDLIQFYGSNPSGHPLTVIINSMVNSLYMRYCYIILTKKSVLTFKDNVKLFTYGDDNIMGVSHNVPEFNHTALSETLAMYGVEYTMADKEAKSVPYINISEATFLKRSWRWDEDVGAMLCPLDHDSIEKMLMVNIRSKFVPHEAQCCSILSSAIREYYFYGKEIFNKKREIFNEAIKELNLEYWFEGRKLPTWEQLTNEFNAFSTE